MAIVGLFVMMPYFPDKILFSHVHVKVSFPQSGFSTGKEVTSQFFPTQ